MSRGFGENTYNDNLDYSTDSKAKINQFENPTSNEGRKLKAPYTQGKNRRTIVNRNIKIDKSMHLDFYQDLDEYKLNQVNNRLQFLNTNLMNVIKDKGRVQLFY